MPDTTAICISDYVYCKTQIKFNRVVIVARLVSLVCLRPRAADRDLHRLRPSLQPQARSRNLP